MGSISLDMQASPPPTSHHLWRFDLVDWVAAARLATAAAAESSSLPPHNRGHMMR